MTPNDFYQSKCQEGIILEDPQQLLALKYFESIYHQLIKEHQQRSGLFSRFRKNKLVKGLYLWGGVGVGKTFLMDCFFQTLPFKQKMRLHFHEFMQRIHDDLTNLQGVKDPLDKLAKELAEQTLVLCFDEFHVTDIVDAMLLGRLLDKLFMQGVCFIATSNITPEDLYKNGLQRSQFIPAIKLIQKNTDVVHITTREDYRLKYLREAGVFYTPLDNAAKLSMEKTFATLTHNEGGETAPIVVNGRPIAIRKKVGKYIWFDFQALCSVPRSQHDYLEIAKQYKTVFISDIPIIPEQDRDKIALFISLIDVFYDARIRIVISAADSIEKLYNRGYMILEYERTHSRLQQMQSMEYFAGEIDHLTTHR